MILAPRRAGNRLSGLKHVQSSDRFCTGASVGICSNIRQLYPLMGLRTMPPRRHGFTLIEILVVIEVIARSGSAFLCNVAG